MGAKPRPGKSGAGVGGKVDRSRGGPGVGYRGERMGIWDWSGGVKKWVEVGREVSRGPNSDVDVIEFNAA